MTIDKAADKMKCLKHKALQGAIIVHDTYSDDYELLNESALTALDMAIASLEAWEKVKAEIEELEKSYGFDKATKYGNKDEKQMDLSYSTMYMYEIAGTVDEIKEIIDKHLQEVTA